MFGITSREDDYGVKQVETISSGIGVPNELKKSTDYSSIHELYRKPMQNIGRVATSILSCFTVDFLKVNSDYWDGFNIVDVQNSSI